MKESVAVAVTFILACLVCGGIFWLCHAVVTGAAQNAFANWRVRRHRRQVLQYLGQVQLERERMYEQEKAERSRALLHKLQEVAPTADFDEFMRHRQRFEEFGGIFVVSEALVEVHDREEDPISVPVETPSSSLHEHAASINEAV